MRVFIEPSGRVIEPFKDPVRETLVGNRPLHDWQADAIRQAGLEQISALQPPCLVLPDTIFCTGRSLREFVDGARGRNSVFVLAESRFGQHTTPVQPHVDRVDAGWRFNKIRWCSGGDEPFEDVCVSPHEKPFDVPVNNPYLQTDKLEFSMTPAPVMTIHHWVHILWANQVYGGIELASVPKWKWIIKGLWAFVRAFSVNKWRIMAKLNQIGAGCDIHPTAIVECSSLGRNVKVGPYARVLLSKIDDGAEIMAGAQVEFCTMAARAIVTENTVVRFSVMYPESVVSQYLMQQCVFGYRAVTTSGAYSMDLNFDREIRVPLDGELHSTGQRFIGSAFGHRCRVGTGFWMASGRMIPNDYFVVRDSADVLSRIPADLSTEHPLMVVGTTLVDPLKRAQSDREMTAPDESTDDDPS
ncbi:MAG: hypothetical protein VX589_09975 [Myxococcota bacterium]|nr:hypothetical protein [Myxococcota bacterium]